MRDLDGDARGAGASGLDGADVGLGNERIEIVLPTNWRIVVEGDYLRGGSWRLVTSDNRVALQGVMPPHSFWPSPRYAASYAFVEAMKELFKARLVEYVRSIGYRNLVEFMRCLGKECALKTYRYLYLSGKKVHEINAVLMGALCELGIARTLRLMQLSKSTFAIESASESDSSDTWFLRGLALTDGCRSSCSFASPKTELIATLVANCSGRLALKDLKLWLSTSEIKITLEYATSCKPFNWVDLLEDIALDDENMENVHQLDKELQNDAHLPRSETDGIELLAGVIAGDGYVNRMTGAITISLNARTTKGRLLLYVVKHLERIGVLEIKSSSERLSEHRELRISINRKHRHDLAKFTPYYKGYRIVNRHYDPVLRKTSIYSHSEEQVDLDHVKVDNKLIETIEHYLDAIRSARIRFSGSTLLHIKCSDAKTCEELMNVLKKLGINPIKHRETRRTFSIARHKETIAYILYRYGKLELDAKTQLIFITWIKRLHDKP